MTGKYPKIELDSFDDQCSIILGYMVFRLWRSIMSYKREVNYYQIIDKGEYLGSANWITNLNNKNNKQSCIYQKNVVPSTNYPKREPLEATVALWCKLQDFKQTKSHLCKHRQFFCLKSCKFENFVVPLQPF